MAFRPGMVRALAGLTAACLAGCNPNSTRPPQVVPVTGAVRIDLALERDRATQEVADQLLLDSIPVTVVQPQDGYLATPWFDAATGLPTDRWPLGPDIVRLQGWIDPGAPHNSHVTVELVYRPMADPSLPGRELDQQVPVDHATALRVGRSLEALTLRFGSRTGG